MNIRQVQKSKASGVKQEQTINVTSDNNKIDNNEPSNPEIIDSVSTMKPISTFLAPKERSKPISLVL